CFRQGQLMGEERGLFQLPPKLMALREETGRTLVISVLTLILVIIVFWAPDYFKKLDGTAATRFRKRAHPDSATTVEIDPPFGFHWGDSTARVEALLGYAGAQITSRAITGDGQAWTAEG